jgi:hypothetical protein
MSKLEIKPKTLVKLKRLVSSHLNASRLIILVYSSNLIQFCVADGIRGVL